MPQTKGTYDFKLQSFESYSEFVHYTMTERSSKTTVSIGFAVPGVAEFGFNYADSKYSKSEKKIRRASRKVRHRSVQKRASLQNVPDRNVLCRTDMIVCLVK